MTSSTVALFIAITAAAFTLPACSSNEDNVDSSEGAATISTIEMNRSHSFTGTFGVSRTRGQVADAKFAFQVTKIDWEALTATWDAQALEGDRVTDDVALPASIVLARCPGCFSVVVRRDNTDVIRLMITEGQLTELDYFGFTGIAPQLKSVSESPGELRSPTGACAIVCGAETAACENVTAEACNDAAFSSRPRCPYEIVFTPGTACPAR